MTKAVLIHEEIGHVQEIDLDIAPSKNEIFKLLCGRQTFIGQWPDLPHPFDVEDVYGKILLVRMDENSDPQDFTLDEYNSFLIGDVRLPV